MEEKGKREREKREREREYERLMLNKIKIQQKVQHGDNY